MGYWFIKFLLLCGMCAGAFFIPKRFRPYWMYMSMAGGFLFIILQLLLLVDFTYAWNATWVGRRYGKRNTCGYLDNPNASLLQASVICLYVVYLTWSALTSQPPEEITSIRDTLTPLAKSRQSESVTGATPEPIPTVLPPAALHDVTRERELLEDMMMRNVSYKCRPEPAFPQSDLVAAYAGLFITFIMAVYASVRTSNAAHKLGLRKREGRACFCCVIKKRKNDSLLTNWYRPAESDLNRFNLNWATVWVKMASSWVCVIIYVWTLFFPRLCFGRNLAFPYEADTEIEIREPTEGDRLDGGGDREAPRRPSSASAARASSLPRSPSSEMRSSRESLGTPKSPKRAAARAGRTSRSPSKEMHSIV
ncbi:hypothetical protein BaRGS_00009071 [Batillaria attramentaria]|uniref:Uncharacterized protein n=1 Tax=Batillaria attramentaria TaxID=370345 RepID=A0ABD0LJN7_9CAEN